MWLPRILLSDELEGDSKFCDDYAAYIPRGKPQNNFYHKLVNLLYYETKWHNSAINKGSLGQFNSV